MSLLASMIAAFAASSAIAAGTGEVIRTAAELQTAAVDRAEVGRPFDIDVLLTTPCRAGGEHNFSAEDETGAVLLTKNMNAMPEIATWATNTFPAGTRARIKGVIELGRLSRRAYPYCRSLIPTGVGKVPPPVRIGAGEFLGGKYDCRLVTVRATVRDIATDEISPDHRYVLLDMDGEVFTMPVSARDSRLAALSAGVRIEATGICAPTQLGMRRQLGRHLQMIDFRVVSNMKDDPFDAPPIGEFTRLRPQEIAALGRHRAIGRVIASWRGDSALLKCDDGRIVRMETKEGSAPPYGARIETVGFPESDLYRVNLSCAMWRRLPENGAQGDETPRDVIADELLLDTKGRHCFDPYVHGHAIRLKGIVRSIPGVENSDGRFSIESGRFMVPVDASGTPAALDGLAIGCEVSVAGTCVMETDNWRPNLPFPAIRGFFVVVRRPSDVEILSRPSWWTPPRLAAVVGALALVLLGSLIWNASLKRQSERRGRELAETAIAKAESDLKVEERTRLAVELHDTISQNLTGLSLSLRAADRFAQSVPDGMREKLKIAAVSLDSCRQELKNCLWDLRNNTLDEADMNDAIRRTLLPHIGDAALSVRFNVPRERFSDKTAHAILHIMRELATNAVRHGHARHIRVAGSIEGDELRFSVRDDGCGFDPDSCPGMDEGHFGLQGVRERVNQMEGAIRFTSRAGEGTKVTISTKARHEEDNHSHS